METYQQLKSIAVAAGCAGFGVTAAEPFAGIAETITERREAGLAGKLRFTYKEPDIAADVRRSLPWAESLVVVSWSYLPEAGNPGPPAHGTGRIARFATDDHYHGLRDALTKIQQELSDGGWRAEVLVDDDRLVDRAAAVRAGIGWWGKNSMVLDPRHGPWLLLGSVATDAYLPIDQPMRRDCGTCSACLPACPTGAIVAPGVLDAARCLAHWLQVGGTIPVELRIPMGDRIYGCDDCLEACPPGSKKLVDASQGRGRVDLMRVLATDDKALLEQYGHFYIPGRRPRVLRRNVIVALGNTTAAAVAADEVDEIEVGETIGVLAGYLGDPDEIYRTHAAWAIGRIGGPAATAVLARQQQRERSPAVAIEIGRAVATLAHPES